ncbi:hypothetical protein JCM9140_3995 [Halalkalibacter wakoensis JCM 9140]|uniref:Uncharacterized protein n=1 Tax=Halalkalibacter wakoensis JCM 9140 TaxID=1236970 RepID=W4Q8V1_9BACI|nr:DUF6407 family protein [Halalkalibacter wakoensis]GAE27834.1 hypothetical protein JCM9140_3995 [Halalkalibacter wakoensis JCM 9140]
MKARKSLKVFSDELSKKLRLKGEMDDFVLRKVIREAITYYQLKTFAKVENDGSEDREVLYIASIAEENMLLKLVELLSEDEEKSMEMIYDSRVVRRH